MKRRHLNTGMSLVEVLLVIAIVGIMAAMVIPYISSMRGLAVDQVARQQQAELQTALGSWIAAQSTGPGGLAATRAAYNGATGSKLQLIQTYLQPATYSALTGNGNSVTSSALTGANAYLEFSDWSSGGQPVVQWINR